MSLSNAQFQRQFVAATKHGEARLSSQPVAIAVRYDRRLRKVIIDLSNGCTLLVPPELAQGLSEASASDLAAAKILGPGTAIDWPKLDVQLSVAGLLTGNFGTAAWMAIRGRSSNEAALVSAAKKHRPAKTKR
jgi:uncharacterized protein DUF2442